MTATADVVAGVVNAEIEIAAPPERVFAAFTDPRQLEAWWGSPATYRTFDWKVDLRPGGAWSCRARSVDGGDVSTVEGEYVAIDPPRRLEFTWLASWAPIGVTHVRVDIEPAGAGSRVTVTHTGFKGDEPAEGFAHGWTRVLGFLEAGLTQEVSS